MTTQAKRRTEQLNDSQSANLNPQIAAADESLRQAEKELAAMSAIAATVSGSLQLSVLLDDTLAKVLEVMQLEAGWVFLREGDGDDLALAVERGLSPRFVEEESTLPLGNCACREVLRTGRALIVGDMLACPRLSPEVVQVEGLRVHASIPLKSKNRVLGVMNVASRDPLYFHSRNLELLTAIGQQIGVAADNARTLENTRRERATLKSVMDSMVDGLILVDTHGKINYWNPRATEFLGIPAAAAMDRPAMGVARRIAMGSTNPEQVSEQLADGLLHFQAFPVIEYELLRPRHRNVQSLLFPIRGDQGEDLGYGITLRDVTGEKELDKLKLQLLSTVSHELRTPLASIKGFTTTLLREDVQWDEKAQRDFLQIIDAESDRLTELISDLLDMSRIEAGALSIEKERIDIHELLQEAVEATRLHGAKHSFVLHAPAHLPRILADSRRISQVVRNLLQNAVKYSPDGGEITVKVTSSSQHLTIQVSDRGVGIPREYHDRIFERFFQVDSASTRRVGGSGLGLAISKSIVEAHGGRIWFESEPGQGSTFYFTLPRNPEAIG
jgi:PAS domain S-box-containing protein